MRSVFAGVLFAAACAGNPATPSSVSPQTATDQALSSIAPTTLAKTEAQRAIASAIESHFALSPGMRGYVMTDKPLYQPGETLYYRADVRTSSALVGVQTGITMQLVSPRGAVVAQHRVMAQGGVATNAFDLAGDIAGGEYTLKLVADTGLTDERKLVINTYEAPRLQKTIEFVKTAYGPGDGVTAPLEIRRATGEPLANAPATIVVTVDDAEIARMPITTDGGGKAVAKLTLPAHIARGDGLLTLIVDDGGVTEAMQKRIPIVLNSVNVSLYPEGGELVAGLPGRVYFAATNPMGKPADVEGKVVDDRGKLVATFASIHDGMGRFELAPSSDRTYHVEITRPANIAQRFAVPAAKDGGCVVRAMAGEPMRVAAVCTTSRTLEVEAVLRDKLVAGGELDVEADKPAVVELPVAGEGAVRVTLLSTKHEPLAERLVYHGRGEDMHVSITADRKTYGPRDAVKLHVITTDATGKPVKASVGVAVVDDTVLSFADDKSAKILAHVFLEPELGVTETDPIEEPNFYFSDKPEATAAMDALLATRGYRRFEWQPVFDPPPPVVETASVEALEDHVAAPPPVKVAAAKPAPVPVANHARPAPPPPPPAQPVAVEKANRDVGRNGVAMNQRIVLRGRAAAIEQQAMTWTPVRVFPVPQYAPSYDGPRTDFRETIYWNGDVHTGDDGAADVSFVMSDAVTSFRATVEGVSTHGLPGAGEAVIQTKLPMTLDVHLPTEVTSGDEIRLPVTLANDSDRDLDATLDAKFGSAFSLDKPLPAGPIHLAAGTKHSLFVPLRVVATDGDADVDVSLAANGLTDQLHKKIRVVPRGFPFEVSASGTATRGKPAVHELALDGAMPGTIAATITMYPSPLAAMTDGMAGMIREPGGCFEQTSSTNYPNIMILGYLQSVDAADPQLLAKTQTTLDHGYKLLTGYETPEKGYEWFGHTPGHEALTAYGLMEFADMGKVFDVDKSMVERTAAWLMSRRDGKGGFARSSEALDSFGRAGETTTNAYIMWALAEAHRTGGMDKELGVQKALGGSTSDPYLLALATNTNLLAAPGADADAMVHRLAGLQHPDGSFTGAQQTITMSGGESVAIETTALATLALIKASGGSQYEGAIRNAVAWLDGKRGGYGQWGNTQATILGLKALTAYSEHARQMQAAGSATLIVNGKEAGTITFDKGQRDALVWTSTNVAPLLAAGNNTIELRLDSDASLPYTMTIDYRAVRPQSSPATKVAIATSLASTRLKMGDGVKLHAHVENTTAGGVPMTLARVGIPGGLVFQTWQLKELRDKGLIDFYETRPREVVLYWRARSRRPRPRTSISICSRRSPGATRPPRARRTCTTRPRTRRGRRR